MHAVRRCLALALWLLAAVVCRWARRLESGPARRVVLPPRIADLPRELLLVAPAYWQHGLIVHAAFNRITDPEARA